MARVEADGAPGAGHDRDQLHQPGILALRHIKEHAILEECGIHRRDRLGCEGGQPAQ